MSKRADDKGKTGIRPAATEWPKIVEKIRERTPARILMGRAGAGYTTATQLELREAHAAASDAVQAELDLAQSFSPNFNQNWKLFEVSTCAGSKAEYLLRPDLGRRLSQSACQQVQERCAKQPDLQIVIGDGLSVAAVAAQVPPLLPLLMQGAKDLGWAVGQPFVVRYCRVGILNHIGELLQPKIVILLIGERPGLATAESLSAYMAYRPHAGHTDAHRNLISNIHARGVLPDHAGVRILRLAEQMLKKELSGTQLKEVLAAPRIRS
ncbi:MAG: ethanolamine ammonia-lyase subunit EutC [Acidobacteriales bacterium]|nr:ethanolamine ammonia-lyase subunit EutC [Terriglobales bacterium]